MEGRKKIIQKKINKSVDPMFLFLSAMMRVDLEYTRHVVSGNGCVLLIHFSSPSSNSLSIGEKQYRYSFSYVSTLGFIDAIC